MLMNWFNWCKRVLTISNIKILGDFAPMWTNNYIKIWQVFLLLWGVLLIITSQAVFFFFFFFFLRQGDHDHRPGGHSGRNGRNQAVRLGVRRWPVRPARPGPRAPAVLLRLLLLHQRRVAHLHLADADPQGGRPLFRQQLLLPAGLWCSCCPHGRRFV